MNYAKYYRLHFPSEIVNSISTVFLVLLSFSMQYACHIFLGRLLGPKLYGDFAITDIVLSISAVVILLGHDNAAIKFIPEFFSSGDWGKVRGFFNTALLIILCTSVMIIVIGTLLLIFLPSLLKHSHKFTTELHTVFYLLWAIPIYGSWTFSNKLLQGLRHPIFASVAGGIIFNLAAGTCYFLVYLYSTHFSVSHAIVSKVTALLVSIAVQLYIVFKVLPKVIYSTTPVYENKRWLIVSVRLFLISFFITSMMRADLILVQLLTHDAQKVGIFSAIIFTSDFVWTIYTAILIVFSPFIGPALNKKNTARIQHLYNVVQTVLIAFIITTGSGMIIFGKQILGLFGPEFVSGYHCFIIVMVGQVVSSALGMNYAVLKFSNYQREIDIQMIVLFIICIVLNYIYIPHYGILAAAYILSGVRLASTLCSNWQIRRYLKIKPLYWI